MVGGNLCRCTGYAEHHEGGAPAAAAERDGAGVSLAGQRGPTPMALATGGVTTKLFGEPVAGARTPG